MLVLPSVGCSVTKILLNESATKAKLFFDDGTTTIVSTQGTAPQKRVVTESAKKPVAVRKVAKKPLQEASGVRIIKTHNGPMAVPTQMSEARKQQLEEQKMSVIERAKKRCAMLESQTITASERLGMEANEGDEVSMS